MKLFTVLLCLFVGSVYAQELNTYLSLQTKCPDKEFKGKKYTHTNPELLGDIWGNQMHATTLVDCAGKVYKSVKVFVNFDKIDYTLAGIDTTGSADVAFDTFQGQKISIGLIDGYANFIIQPVYTELGFTKIKNSDAYIIFCKQNLKSGRQRVSHIDESGKLVHPIFTFNDARGLPGEFFKAKGMNNKWGVFNYSGELILDTMYWSVDTYKSYSTYDCKNLLMVRNEENGDYNLAGNNGIINPEYKNPKISRHYLTPFNQKAIEFYAITDTTGVFDIINTEGQLLNSQNPYYFLFREQVEREKVDYFAAQNWYDPNKENREIIEKEKEHLKSLAMIPGSDLPQGYGRISVTNKSLRLDSSDTKMEILDEQGNTLQLYPNIVTNLNQVANSAEIITFDCGCNPEVIIKSNYYQNYRIVVYLYDLPYGSYKVKISKQTMSSNAEIFTTQTDTYTFVLSDTNRCFTF